MQGAYETEMLAIAGSPQPASCCVAIHESDYSHACCFNSCWEASSCGCATVNAFMNVCEPLEPNRSQQKLNRLHCLDHSTETSDMPSFSSRCRPNRNGDDFEQLPVGQSVVPVSCRCRCIWRLATARGSCRRDRQQTGAALYIDNPINCQLGEIRFQSSC